ncbi:MULTISPECIES: NAD-dependent epimerase [Parapedobacter]|uniref:NAD-dependent epimerase n=1 Tax=Parapedobacter TaxID=416949 RepID=UPI00333E2D53
MKILVTGATGFIGFHLVNALLKRGYHVVGIDNINDYYDVNLKYGRLAECGVHRHAINDNTPVQSQTHPAYTFQKTDITDLACLSELFEIHQFDRVFHLAAQPGVRYSMENPHAYVQSNVVGFVNMLECCRHHQVKHFVYASSSSVYGTNTKVPFHEDDRVDHPVSLYAATKRSNELLAHTYSHLYQLPTTGLRFFTVYGPWGRPDMAPMLFADAICSGKPIKVFNGGDMHRDFTYIDDIVEGVVRAGEQVPAATDIVPYYRIFNIGNSRPIHLMEFIRIMETAFGLTAKLDMYPMQPGDLKTTYADTSALAETAGYKPDTPLHDGVGRFVSWYNDVYR